MCDSSISFNLDNDLVRLIQICMINQLFSCLLPNKFKTSDECHDLYSLMLCCKNMKKILKDKFLHILTFKLSQIKEFDEKTVNKINVLHFDFSFLPKNVNLPSNLKELTFAHTFNEELNREFLPKKLTKLTFGVIYDQPLKECVLPECLTELNLNYSFNQPLTFLPKDLKTLTIKGVFNQPIAENILPKKLTKLVFGKCFNQPLTIDVLPKQLNYLRFGDNFNQPLKLLPKQLNYLRFGDNFNQPLLEGVLPEKLLRLIIRNVNYSEQISLPKNAKLIKYKYKN